MTSSLAPGLVRTRHQLAPPAVFAAAAAAAATALFVATVARVATTPGSRTGAHGSVFTAASTAVVARISRHRLAPSFQIFWTFSSSLSFFAVVLVV